VANNVRRSYRGYGFRQGSVVEVLKELDLFTGRANVYGYILPGDKHQVQAGGGIAGNNHKYAVVEIASGKGLTPMCGTKTELRRALKKWKLAQG
jgi:hypothetical protein